MASEEPCQNRRIRRCLQPLPENQHIQTADLLPELHRAWADRRSPGIRPRMRLSACGLAVSGRMGVWYPLWHRSDSAPDAISFGHYDIQNDSVIIGTGHRSIVLAAIDGIDKILGEGRDVRHRLEKELGIKRVSGLPSGRAYSPYETGKRRNAMKRGKILPHFAICNTDEHGKTPKTYKMAPSCLPAPEAACPTE